LPRSRRWTSPPPDAPIRIVVVEHRAILAVGVREILDREPDIDVVAYVRTPGEAMSAIDEADPDVVLVDVEFRQPEATEATRRLHQGAPESILVVIGGDDDASIIGAIEIGATAHVASTAEPAELVSTIRRVADGEDPLKHELIDRPDLVDRIVDGIRESIDAEHPPTHPLSPRELEVLTHVAAGLRNRDIGNTLGVSETTVRNHVSSILHKLGVPNRTRAVTYAARQGWLVLEDMPNDLTVRTGHAQTGTSDP
jgi:DNA-binding NarL/FixJ family response regulator